MDNLINFNNFMRLVSGKKGLKISKYLINTKESSHR